MKVHFAAQALKETLSVGQVYACLQEGIRLAGEEAGRCTAISDGGDGFLESWILACGATMLHTMATSPLGVTLNCGYALDSRGNCYIEMAQASGLSLVPPGQRDIWKSSTCGTGDVIFSGLQHPLSTMFIGLGGSATNDGGIGMLAALSDQIGLTNFGRPMTLLDIPAALTIPLSALREALSSTRLVACSDVTSPLLGPSGCSAVFAPQKGATAIDIVAMEAAMTRWADHVESALENNYRDVPGAGAAGGLGFALVAMGAAVEPGAQLFLKETAFLGYLKPDDILLTTEGRFDTSSMLGKAPWIVSTEALAKDTKPVILCGSADPTAVAEATRYGVTVTTFGDHIAVPDRVTNSPAALIRAVTQSVIAEKAARL